jgi:hypothetical protein
MAVVVMDQDLDSGTNPPAYEDLRCLPLPLFVELQATWLVEQGAQKDRFISVFLFSLKLNQIN